MKIADYIAEATECDFKVAVETKKPKSWLKSGKRQQIPESKCQITVNVVFSKV